MTTDKSVYRERAYNKAIANIEEAKRRIERNEGEIEGHCVTMINEELLQVTKRSLDADLKTWSYILEALELYDFIKK